MPTYRALGTTVQLVTCSLAESTTTNPQRTKGSFPTNEAVKARNVFKEAKPLKESYIPCFGDKTRLHFLGNAPFYLVQAGEGLFKRPEPTLAEKAQEQLEHRRKALVTAEQRGDEDGAQEDKLDLNAKVIAAETQSVASSTTLVALSPLKPEENPTPQALAVVVNLTKSTFLHLFDGEGRSLGTRQNVKIDVFFNGELASSDCVHIRPKNLKGQEGIENHMLRVISGKRVGRLVERAWVITPSEQNPDGSLRELRRSKVAQASATEHWQMISNAIMRRADEQSLNDDGERPAVGHYLADLASMTMPEAVDALQKPGGHRFGIIDVVITAGKGSKGSTANSYYLTEPTYLSDKSLLDDASAAHFNKIIATPYPCSSAPDAMQGLTIDENVPKSIAATRERRSRRMPFSYRIARLHRSRGSTPKVDEADEKANVLPNLPPVSEYCLFDLDNTNAISPSRFSVPIAGPNVAPVVPETQSHKHVDIPMPDASGTEPETTTTATVVSNIRSRIVDSIERSDKVPPRTPVTLAQRWSNRRQSVDRLMTSKGAVPMQRLPFLRLSTGGMPKSTMSKKSSETISNGGDGPLVHRVVLNGRGTAVIDRLLSEPYDIRAKRKVYRYGPDPSSPFQPLPESVVFGLRDVSTTSANGLDLPLTPRGQAIREPTPSASSPSFQRLPNVAPAQLTKTDPAKRTTNTTREDGARTPPSPKPPYITSTGPLTPTRMETRASTTAPTPDHLYTPSKPSVRRRRADERTPLEETRETWKVPELSEDCVITFAEEGDWDTVTKEGSVLRHIRSERSGHFKENEVVFAVRFIVAGEAGLTL